MDLTVFLEPQIDLARISRVLDELGLAGRLDTIRGWEARQQAALFEAAKGFKPLTLEHFVPASVGPMVEVVHHGKNSLPLFTHFKKKMCRPAPNGDGGDAGVWGYNDQEFQMWTGPGYFVLHETDTPGEPLVDYRRLPTGKAPGWPDVLPNRDRLGRFVYENLSDVMRGISKHVSIGRARRGKHWLDAWFVLCREDPG